MPDVEKQGDLIYLTYFNVGLRIFNVADPRLPKETGWFILPTPVKRLGPLPAKLVNQTEDMLVDTRGNIYIADKQWGLFILRCSGLGEPKSMAKRRATSCLRFYLNNRGLNPRASRSSCAVTRSPSA